MRRLTIVAAFLAALCVLIGAEPAFAGDGYRIEIRIISAQPTGGKIDPQLKRYASDLKAMPFKSFRQLDFHSKQLKKGETVSMQFPGPGRRFLKVQANGTKGGKHRFKLAIDALRFKTMVRIPNNGTLIVGGPKHDKGVILMAITAKGVK